MLRWKISVIVTGLVNTSKPVVGQMPVNTLDALTCAAVYVVHFTTFAPYRG